MLFMGGSPTWNYCNSLVMSGCFLTLLLEYIKKNDNPAGIKTTKDPINITSSFYPDLVKPICTLKMFKKFFRNPVYNPDNFENILWPNLQVILSKSMCNPNLSMMVYNFQSDRSVFPGAREFK